MLSCHFLRPLLPLALPTITKHCFVGGHGTGRPRQAGDAVHKRRICRGPMSILTCRQRACLQPGLPGRLAGLLQPARHAERMFRGRQPVASGWKCKPGRIEGDRVTGKPSHLAPLVLSQQDFPLSPSSCQVADHPPGSAEPLYDSRCCHPPRGEAAHLIQEECWPCGRR